MALFEFERYPSIQAKGFLINCSLTLLKECSFAHNITVGLTITNIVRFCQRDSLWNKAANQASWPCKSVCWYFPGGKRICRPPGTDPSLSPPALLSRSTMSAKSSFLFRLCNVFIFYPFLLCSFHSTWVQWNALVQYLSYKSKTKNKETFAKSFPDRKRIGLSFLSFCCTTAVHKQQIVWLTSEYECACGCCGHRSSYLRIEDEKLNELPGPSQDQVKPFNS